MRILTLASAIFFLALVFQAGDATAFPPEVDKIYQAAKQDLKENRTFPALEKFRQCLELVRGDDESTWNLLMAVSLTYEQMGQLDHAVEYYRRFLVQTGKRGGALSEKWQKRREAVKNSIVTHEQSVMELRGMVEINSIPEGAEIRVDGAAIGADGVAHTPFIAYIMPGSRKIQLSKRGFRGGEAVVDVIVGNRTSIDLSLKKAKKRKGVAKKKGAKPKKKAAKPKSEQKVAVAGVKDSASSSVWPWVAVGSGVAALGGGYVFTMKAQSASDDIDALATVDDENERYDSLADEIKTNNMIALSLYGLGAAAVLGGTFWLLSSGGDADRTAGESTSLIAVVPWSGGAYVQTGWVW